MRTRSYLQAVRSRRIRCKSQAFVEFAILLPLLLLFMCGVFDYSFMILRLQVMALAARDAANTASRQSPATAMNIGLQAAYNAAAPMGVNFSGKQGAVIISHVWYKSGLGIPPADVILIASNYMDGPTANPLADQTVTTSGALGAEGELFANMDAGDYNDKTYSKSHILAYDTTGGGSYESIYRALPFPGTNNLVDGDTRGVYAVETLYTNQYITPVGNLMGQYFGGTVSPRQLYDAAFFGVIIGAPVSSVSIPATDTLPPTPPTPGTPPPPPPPSPPSPPSPPISSSPPPPPPKSSSAAPPPPPPGSGTTPPPSPPTGAIGTPPPPPPPSSSSSSPPPPPPPPPKGFGPGSGG